MVYWRVNLERYSLGGILERVTVRGGSSGRLTQPLADYLSPCI